MKKLAGLLAVIMTLVLCLTSCGTKKQGTVNGEDVAVVPEDTYEIQWYMSGTQQTDVTSVENAVNEYLKDKINATLRLNVLETSQYQKKMSTMIAAGEYFDLAFCSNWMLDYQANSLDGAFFQLDDYAETYMPKTMAQFDDYIIESVKVDGKLYTIPAMKEYAQQKGWIYRKDIADKYNIDMSQYKSFEDLMPVLKMIQENEPDLKYPISWGTDNAPAAMLGYKGYGSGVALYYDGTYPQDTVVNAIETPEFQEACEMAYKYYQEGLVPADIVTDNDYTTKMKTGNLFCYMEFLKPGKAAEAYQNSEFEIAQVGVEPVIMDSLPGTGSMLAISETSKNPYRVMRFLELLNTDPYLNNLILYGIEDKHYTKVDDKTVKVIDGTGYTMSGKQWMLGNIFINYLTTDEDPNKLADLKAFNNEAQRNDFTEFSFITTPVESELAACSAVTKQYRNQVVKGGMDPVPVLETYKEALRTAGIEKIMTEVQRQYDIFLAK